jgi:hypothetical protein
MVPAMAFGAVTFGHRTLMIWVAVRSFPAPGDTSHRVDSPLSRRGLTAIG